MTDHPHLLLDDDYEKAVAERRAVRGKLADALALEGVRLENLMSLTQHPGFAVMQETFDTMLSAVISLKPVDPELRADRDGLIRGIDTFRQMFVGLEEKAQRLATEKEQS